ncbi:hypothetical protein KVR01_008307 [Diaporthe batatas]|uniref:uncharacterized protein n=1 Tax=Diaporthe batatas TaxID=748121 RepID=UPI001D03D2D7|nr:uncharacterized protein KVR01_008307 [Diaporthe batatas]KAG8162542.1 hypothetical protein KVR01_008307 [Diaporthe batatas]
MEEDAESRPHRRQKPPPRTIAALLGLLLLVNLSASLYQLPLNRVVERRLCQEYYSQHDPSVIGPTGDIDERLCKADAIQAGLGRIQGVMDTEWIVGDFVMTIPLGFVAERYGRRALLWLNLVPRVFMLSWAVIVGYFDQLLPTNAIVAGPVLSFLGGDCVFNSITYSLAAGITNDYVLRASYFGYMSSITYVVNLLGPALASASMTLLLWLPFWIGITLLGVAVAIIPMLPDHEIAKDQRDEQSQPLLSSPLLKAQDSGPTILHSVIGRFQALRAALATHPWNFSLLLACFLLASLASSDTKLLVQYISKRYQWTFASAGYLLSGKAVVNFVLLTVVVPRVLRSAMVASSGSGASGLSSDRINVRFAKLCLGVSVVGAAAIAVSTTIWLLVPALLVYALGSALPVFTLSLLKSPSICCPGADRGDDGRESSSPGADSQTHIFSIVMLVKTLGSLLGAPLMAFLWVRGIGLGGAALGMPYFVSAGCYAAAIFIFCRIEIDQ